MNDKSGSSRQDRRREQTQKLLIETTLKLIMEKGYDAITVKDITDQADVGRGTFYIYFKDKTEVFWAAIQDTLQELELEAHQQLDRSAPQVEYLALIKIFQHAEKNSNLYRAALGGQGSAMLVERIYDLMAKMLLEDIKLAQRQNDTGFHIPDEALAQMLTGLLTRLILWWLESPDDYSAEELASMAYEMIYRRKAPL